MEALILHFQSETNAEVLYVPESEIVDTIERLAKTHRYGSLSYDDTTKDVVIVRGSVCEKFQPFILIPSHITPECMLGFLVHAGRLLAIRQLTIASQTNQISALHMAELFEWSLYWFAEPTHNTRDRYFLDEHGLVYLTQNEEGTLIGPMYWAECCRYIAESFIIEQQIQTASRIN